MHTHLAPWLRGRSLNCTTLFYEDNTTLVFISMKNVVCVPAQNDTFVCYHLNYAYRVMSLRYVNTPICSPSCAAAVGRRHPAFVEVCVYNLLRAHPWLSEPEPAREDAAYITVLLLVLNAHPGAPGIAAHFPRHLITSQVGLKSQNPPCCCANARVNLVGRLFYFSPTCENWCHTCYRRRRCISHLCGSLPQTSVSCPR